MAEEVESTKAREEYLFTRFYEICDKYPRNRAIIYLGEEAQGKRTKVQTHFITDEGKTVSVDFSMRKIDNIWKIYDVTIEGVSMLSSYRSQFNSILGNSSFNDLLAKLKEKEKEFTNVL